MGELLRPKRCRVEPVSSGMRLLLLTWLWGLGRLATCRAVDCASLTKNWQATFSLLQPCLSGSATIVLDGPSQRRFVSPAGAPRQVLDLAFQQNALTLSPGAEVEVVSANILGMRLYPPSSNLRLLGVAVQPTAFFTLKDVLLETDCVTLSNYQQWVNSSRPDNISLSANGDLLVASWRVGGTTMTACNITCSRPTMLVSPLSPAPGALPGAADGSSGSGVDVGDSGGGGYYNTTVLITRDLDLYHAFTMRDSFAPGSVTLLLVADVTLTLPLWVASGFTFNRDFTIQGGRIALSSGSSSSSGGSGGGGSSGGGNTRGDGAFRKPILDLQDLTSVVFLTDGAVLSIVNVTLVNVGMVFGVAPVQYTGLGFVPSFMWFVSFPRVVFTNTKPPIQLRLAGCDIVSYPEDLEHMSLWSMFITNPVGPYASLAAAFTIGVWEIKIDKASEPDLRFLTLNAYSMLYTDVTLTSSDRWAANATMMARRSGSALYKLYIPVSVSAVPIWSQSDLQVALATAQQETNCSRYSNITTYLHIFNNISLDFNRWPGYNIPCPINISGSLDRVGGTWLNFNLLPRFISLSNSSSLSFRSITLFNMPSQQRTYNLGDLTQMTLPLWPIARPPGTSLTLLSSTIVLPVEEFHSLAATLAVSTDGVLSHALNASVRGFQLGVSSSHFLTVNFFDGLNMTAIDTVITDTSGYVPYSSPLGPNIYGTASSRSSPPGPGGSGGGGSRDGGLSSTAILAIALAVPLSCAAMALTAWLLLLHRRHSAVRVNNNGGAAAAPSKAAAELETVATSPAPSGAGGGSTTGAGAGGGGDGRGDGKGQGAAGTGTGTGADSASPNGSDGNSPLSNQSGMMEAAVDASNQDKSIAKASGFDSDATPTVPPLHVELHQLILDFAREIEDKHLTIHDALGSGGFATVYRGTWRGIDVAVKVIEFQDRAAGDERLQARAMTEAAIAANIQHANIVTTYSYDIRPVQPNDPGLDTPSSSTLLGIGPSPEGGGGPLVAAGAAAGGTGLMRRKSGSSDQSGSNSQAPRMWKLYLIQEFCEVGSLRVALENRMLHTTDGLPNMPMILRLALDVVRGLQHLHKKNIIHGDLTPGNILLKANLYRPGHYTAKLADFGLSVKMTPAQTSVDNNRTGTPFYASPEVRSLGNLTKASDIYALGVVMWEMWHGRPCYQRVRGVKHYIHATGYPNFPAQCPPVYADLAGRCMRRALDERPQLGEVHDTLRNLLGAAVGGMSSGSTVGSDAGTSGAASYEWPFVLQMAQEQNGGGVTGAGGGAMAWTAAQQDGSAAVIFAMGATGGGGGSSTSSTRSTVHQAGGLAGFGRGALAAAAVGAAAGGYLPPPPPVGHAADVKMSMTNPGAAALAAPPMGMAWGAVGAGGAVYAPHAGAGGTSPRGTLGSSRLNQESCGQAGVMMPQQAHQLFHALPAFPPQQSLPPPPQQPHVQHHNGFAHQQQLQHAASGMSPSLQGLSPAVAAAAGYQAVPAGAIAAPAVAGLGPRMPHMPAAASLPVEASRDAAALQQEGCALAGHGDGAANELALKQPIGAAGGPAANVAQGPTCSISLNMPTADHFVSALGSRTED